MKTSELTQYAIILITAAASSITYLVSRHKQEQPKEKSMDDLIREYERICDELETQRRMLNRALAERNGKT